MSITASEPKTIASQSGRKIDVRAKNITGKRFGLVTVLFPVGRTKSRCVIWRISCECGKFKDVASESLLSGKTKSCGCMIGKYKRPIRICSISGCNRKRFSNGMCNAHYLRSKRGLDLNTPIMSKIEALSIGWKEKSKTKKPDIICPICSCPFRRTGKRKNLTKMGACCSKKCSSKALRGRFVKEKSPRWKGGMIGQLQRYSYEGVQWRKAVLKRDRKTCQNCGNQNQIHVHHIKPWALFPELRFTVSNGVCLCKSCHAEQHNDYRFLINS